MLLPSLRRRPPRVSVIIDTSGSASDDENRADYRPDHPPEWARVVTIG